MDISWLCLPESNFSHLCLQVTCWIKHLLLSFRQKFNSTSRKEEVMGCYLSSGQSSVVHWVKLLMWLLDGVAMLWVQKQTYFPVSLVIGLLSFLTVSIETNTRIYFEKMINFTFSWQMYELNITSCSNSQNQLTYELHIQILKLNLFDAIALSKLKSFHRIKRGWGREKIEMLMNWTLSVVFWCSFVLIHIGTHGFLHVYVLNVYKKAELHCRRDIWSTKTSHQKRTRKELINEQL